MLALFGSAAMFSLSPECAPKRTSLGRSNLWVHPLGDFLIVDWLSDQLDAE
jgi:hypothetical protein